MKRGNTMAHNGILHQRAKEVFDRLITKATMGQVVSTITRSNNSLRHYDDEQAYGSQYYSGVQTIPIDAIKGSLNRSHDFDANFLPKSSKTKET